MGNRSFTVYVPAVQVTIHGHSRMLEHLGDFARFLLWHIGSGYDMGGLEDRIMLPHHVIQEDLDWLREYGMIGGEAPDYYLLPLGKEYYAVIRYLETREKEGIPAVVDLYTGNVMLLKGAVPFLRREKLPENALVLKRNIPKFSLSNDNYQNSLDLLQKDAQKDFGVPEACLDSFYTTITLEKGGDTYSGWDTYLECTVEEYIEGAPDGPRFEIAVPIGRYGYRKFYNCLDQVRPVLENARQVMESRPEFLSDAGKRVLQVYEQERAEPIQYFCVDLYSMDILKSLPPESLCGRDENQLFQLPAKNVCISFDRKDQRIEQCSADESRAIRRTVDYRAVIFPEGVVRDG